MNLIFYDIMIYYLQILGRFMWAAGWRYGNNEIKTNVTYNCAQPLYGCS